MAVHPIIGNGAVGVNKYGWLVIMKSSENVKAANWFLNAHNDKELQLLYASKSGVVPVNQKAIKLLKSGPVLAEVLQLNPADIAKELRIWGSRIVNRRFWYTTLWMRPEMKCCPI